MSSKKQRTRGKSFGASTPSGGVGVGGSGTIYANPGHAVTMYAGGSGGMDVRSPVTPRSRQRRAQTSIPSQFGRTKSMPASKFMGAAPGFENEHMEHYPGF